MPPHCCLPGDLQYPYADGDDFVTRGHSALSFVWQLVNLIGSGLADVRDCRLLFMANYDGIAEGSGRSENVRVES
jgi:hypothetical protein